MYPKNVLDHFFLWKGSSSTTRLNTHPSHKVQAPLHPSIFKYLKILKSQFIITGLSSSKSAKEGFPGRSIMKEICKAADRSSCANQGAQTQRAIPCKFLCVLFYTAPQQGARQYRQGSERAWSRDGECYLLMLPLSTLWVVSIDATDLGSGFHTEGLPCLTQEICSKPRTEAEDSDFTFPSSVIAPTFLERGGKYSSV